MSRNNENPYKKGSARHKLWARREADKRKKEAKPKGAIGKKPRAKQPKGAIGKAKKALSGRQAQLDKQMEDLGI